MKIKKILIFVLSFFIFGIPSIFSDAPNEYEGIKRIIVTKNKNETDLIFKNTENEESTKYIDFEYVDTTLDFGKVLYKYTNQNGETIIFGNGIYCNITEGTCKNFTHHMAEFKNYDFTSYNIIDHNDYILFYYFPYMESRNWGGPVNSGNVIYIYSKKLDKFFILSLEQIFTLKSISDFFSNDEYIEELYQKNRGSDIKKIYERLKNGNVQEFFKFFGSAQYNGYTIKFKGKTLIFSVFLYDNIYISYNINFDEIPEDKFNNLRIYKAGFELKNFELKNLHHIYNFFLGNNSDKFYCRFYKNNCGYNENDKSKTIEDLENVRPLKAKDLKLVFYYKDYDYSNSYDFSYGGFKYEKKENIPGLSMNFSSFMESGLNLKKTYYREDEIVQITNMGVGYFFDGAMIFTSKGNLLKKSVQVGNKEISTSGLFTHESFEGLWNYFRDFKILSFSYSNVANKYYLTYLKKPSVGNWSFHTLIFGNFGDLQLGNYQILDGLYRVGNFGNIILYVDETLFRGNLKYIGQNSTIREFLGLDNFLNSDIYYSPFFISKYGGNYNFYIISKTNQIIKSTTGIFNFGDGDFNYEENLKGSFSDYILNSGDGFSLNKSNFEKGGKKGNTLTETGNENYKTEEETKEEFEKIKNNENLSVDVAYNFFGTGDGISRFINTFKSSLSFSFPEDWQNFLKIPLISPNINNNGRLVLSYNVYNVNLLPVEDRLKINSLGKENTTETKKIISFFLAFLYISTCLVLFYLSYFFISFIFSIIKNLKDIFFPFVENTDSKGNVFTAGLFMGYVLLFISYISGFFIVYAFLSGFLIYVKGVIILIFGFVVSNFFDFDVFVNVINIFQLGILGALFGYIGVKLSLAFGKIF